MNTVMFKDLEKDRPRNRPRGYLGERQACRTAYPLQDEPDGRLQRSEGHRGDGSQVGTAGGRGDRSWRGAGVPGLRGGGKKQGEKGREIKVIYGMEGYVFDDADCMQEDGSIDYKSKPTHHIIILAKTQEGLKNIYKFPIPT